ncbi:hypothetical protein [Puia sp.]|jgi:hypothetical protein|uniref:hypothetical protein n=1 Tax=Puia sp. TaxID=2045100 RepID=UPI002F3F1C34
MDNAKLMAAMGVMYRTGEIHSFADILKYVPRTAIAKAIGLGGVRFKSKCDSPATFTNHEIDQMAPLLDIPVEDLRAICRSAGEGK